MKVLQKRANTRNYEVMDESSADRLQVFDRFGWCFLALGVFVLFPNVTIFDTLCGALQSTSTISMVNINICSKQVQQIDKHDWWLNKHINFVLFVHLFASEIDICDLGCMMDEGGFTYIWTRRVAIPSAYWRLLLKNQSVDSLLPWPIEWIVFIWGFYKSWEVD